jgi:hypothetical protein
MRRATILAGVGLLVAVCFAGGKDGAVQVPVTYKSVRQRGQIKVTLLKVSRIALFDIADASGNARLVTGVEVSYLVEDLKAGPPRQIKIDAPKCFIAGKLVDTVDGLNQVIVEKPEPWWATDSQTAVARPKVASAEHTRLERDYVRGVVPEGDHVDLTIEAGVDEMLTFNFANVPLGAAGR